MSLHRCSLALLLALAACGSGSKPRKPDASAGVLVAHDQGDTAQVVDRDGGWQVELPGMPIVKRDTEKTTIAVLQRDREAVIFSVTTLGGSEPIDADLLGKMTVAGMAPRFEKFEQGVATIGGRPGFRFSGHRHDAHGNFEIDEWLVVDAAHRRMYQLNETRQEGDAPHGDIDKVVASFRRTAS